MPPLCNRGDVIILPRNGSPQSYVLRLHEGPDSVICETREAAMGEARAYAEDSQVNAWLAEDGMSMWLLSRHRPIPRI